MTTGPLLNVHSLLSRSRANGPGWRTVVWLQGCSLGCPGCFNPETHATRPRRLMTIEGILAEATHRGDVEGLTVSGGEPLQQPRGLLALLQEARRTTHLSVLLFSGYTLEEIRGLPLGPSILSCVDVLIDGRYDSARPRRRGLRGSTNQRAHFLTSRYGPDDLDRIPKAEVIVDSGGAVTATGIVPLTLFPEETP